MKTSTQRSISELTLNELFPQTLADSPCVFIDKEREVWVATEMCAQYLESAVDSIVVVDSDSIPVGIVGGYDLLDNLRKNPTRDFQYKTKVEEIMFRDVPEVEKETKLKDLIKKWQNTRRAFAILGNESNGYSAISARKMLDIGMRCKTDISVSSMSKNKIVTFQPNDTVGKLINMMFENKTRKLILENSNQFISDRLILAEISRILKFEKDVESFLDMPAKQLRLDYVKTITDDLPFDYICSLMNKMGHPYMLYKNTSITPWDVCLALMSEDMKGPLRTDSQKKCPHCGKDID
ncbi:MAG: CBS domain-containing protein [Nitrosopumilales archaeon]|nr:CBS domain-containing protein [Nitrosopumilales archaeon]